MQVILHQLRRAEHGFREDGQEADNLDERDVIDEQVHNYRGDDAEDEHTVQIGLEVGPIPEVFHIEV